ncbi:MAG: mechanosensitive ion channel [Saprospiraceae bacterium]
MALATAAQDAVKPDRLTCDLFDKPFQIGDWVIAAKQRGEIVEVGFRSTRIKTVDSSIITM